jgi:hypothetical protein
MGPMGRKRVKQYLMLLLAVGVIAVVASGSGTFASFNAEVTNGGNTFATGSLILNNTNGNTTCTSAFGTLGTANTNASGVDCATLFSNVTFSPVHATANGTNGASSITLTAITGGAIYRGDKLVVKPTSGPAFTVTADNAAPITTATAVPIVETITAATFTGASVLDASPTAFADVKLENAGTIAANDIILTPSGCTSSYGEGSGTLGTPVSAPNAVTSVPFSGTGTFVAGEPVVVSNGSHSQTFIATGPPAAGAIPVQTGQNWNFSYLGTATVSGPQFNGGSANNICSNLRLSVIEETQASFPSNLFGNAVVNGCVYGSPTPTPANSNACDLTAGTLLTSTAATTLTGGGLAASATRYFELAVHVDGTSFDNTFQNTKTSAFSLTWHIDQ